VPPVTAPSVPPFRAPEVLPEEELPLQAAVPTSTTAQARALEIRRWRFMTSS
jgi:hypothetical protein